MASHGRTIPSNGHLVEDEVTIRGYPSSNAHVVDELHLDTVLLLSQTDDEFDDAQDDKSMEPFELDELQLVNRSQGNANEGRITGYVVLASIMAGFGGILFGYDIGIISGAMLQLRDEFHLSCMEQSVVVSALLLGAMIASMFGGFIIDAIGRRMAIILTVGIFIAGALITTLAQSYMTLVIGRLILGVAVSLSVIAECIYISEISPAKRRGSLVSINELGITVGILFAYLVNFLFIDIEDGWRYMFGISIIPALIQGIGMIFLPPSPRYLLTKQREQEASIVLQKIRGTADVEDELVQIRTAIRTEKDYTMCDLFKSIDNMRGRMMIGIGLVFFQQATGQTNVLYYAPTVFQMLGFQSDSAATLATVGLGFIKAAATVVCLLCVDKSGRRRFLLIGTLMMAIVISVLGVTSKVLPSESLTPPCVSVQVQFMSSNASFNSAVTMEMSVTMDTTTLLLGYNETNSNQSERIAKRSLRDLLVFLGSLYDSAKLEGDFRLELQSDEPGQRLQVIGHSSQFASKQEDSLQYLQLLNIYNGDVSLERFLREANLLNDTSGKQGNSTDGDDSRQDVGSVAAKYIALVSLMLYLAAYSFGFGPVTWILLSEIFPSGIRGRATAFATIFNWGINLIMSLTFLQIMNTIGISWTFILYGMICIISAVFVYFFVPETKNRSLEQVSSELNNSLWKKMRKRGQLLPCCCKKNLSLPVSYGRYTDIRRGPGIDRVSHVTPFDFIPDSTF